MLQKICGKQSISQTLALGAGRSVASSGDREKSRRRDWQSILFCLFIVGCVSVSPSSPPLLAQDAAKAEKKDGDEKRYRLPKKYQASLNEIVVPAFQAKQYEFAYPYLVSLMSELPE